MANKIQIRRGLKANLPTLSVGEPGLCTDTKEFYIGNGNKNIELANIENTNQISQISNTILKMQNGENVDIVFIGDSVMQGTQYTTPDKCYVGLFANKIKELYPNAHVFRIDGQADNPQSNNEINNWTTTEIGTATTNQKINIIKCAVGGDTVSRIQRRIADITKKCLTGKPDLVFIGVGINDSINDGNKYVPAKQYAIGLNALVGYIKRSYGNPDVVILTSNWCGDTLESQTIIDYVKMQKEVGISFGIEVVDINKIWREHYIVASGNYGQGDWLNSGDNTHPNEKGHKAMFNYIFERLFPKNIKVVEVEKPPLYFIDANENKRNFNYIGTWSLNSYSKNLNTEYGAYETMKANDSVKIDVMAKKGYLLTRMSKNTGKFKIRVNSGEERIIDLSTTYPTGNDETTADLNGYFYVMIALIDNSYNRWNEVIITNLENKTLSIMGIQCDVLQVLPAMYYSYDNVENLTTELANGVIEQIGVITDLTTDTGVITFNTPFPTKSLNVQMTCFSVDGNPTACIWTGGDGKTKVGYKINRNGATKVTIYWRAVGK